MSADTRARHTRGPWSYHYSRSAPDDEWIIGAEGFAPVIAFVVPDEDSKLTGAQVEANARLIAAAPEMVDAGNALSAYVYALLNPGQIPEHVKAAMRVFEALA